MVPTTSTPAIIHIYHHKSLYYQYKTSLYCLVETIQIWTRAEPDGTANTSRDDNRLSRRSTAPIPSIVYYYIFNEHNSSLIKNDTMSIHVYTVYIYQQYWVFDNNTIGKVKAQDLLVLFKLYNTIIIKVHYKIRLINQYNNNYNSNKNTLIYIFIFYAKL